MDLFTPIVAPERFHPNFANCIKSANSFDQSVVLDWADGFIDRDGKFVEEFQTTFNSSFWELYLHAILKEGHCKIDFSHGSPDFVVTGPSPFIVEATVALNAQDALPEWTPLDLNLRPGDLNEFNRAAMVRLLNSISQKSKKYLKSYQELEHVADKPFVLALTPFDQPFFYLEVQRAIEAVLYDYYVDEQAYIDDPSKMDSVSAKNLKTVRKKSDVELPLGLFNDASYAHISAVLINSCATWGKVRALGNDPHPFMMFSAIRSDPRNGDCLAFRGLKADYEESLCDGLRVYHNQHATHRLDWQIFESLGAYQAVCVDPESHEWTWSMDRPPLVARNLLTENIPDGVDAATVIQQLGIELRARWEHVPFTTSLVSELAAMQRKDR